MKPIFIILLFSLVIGVMTVQAARQTRTDFNEWAVNYVAGLHIQKTMPERLDVNAFYPVALPKIAGVN